MIAAWMVYTVEVGLLVAVGARGLEDGVRLTGRPVRFVWLVAFMATVGLGALGAVRSWAGGDLTVASAVEAAVVAPADGGVVGRSAGVGRWSAALSGVREVMTWPVRWAARGAEDHPVGLPVGLWLVLTAGLASLWVGTLLRYRAARRGWPRREVCGVAVRVAPAAGPAVMGLLRQEIVVPAWLMAAPPEERRLVVLHEREHLRARDAWVLAAGWLIFVVLPWNPVAWWMLSRLRAAVELDCDARVLRAGEPRRSYGSMLIDIAGRGPGLPLGVPALGGSRSTLERRILAMSSSFSRAAWFRAAGFGTIGLLALLGACDARMPTSAEVEEMDATSAEARARELGLAVGNTANTVYVVDGVEVAAEEARAIPAERIEQVRIIKAHAPDEHVMEITTRELEITTSAPGVARAGAAGDEPVQAGAGRRDSLLRSSVLLRPEPDGPAVRVTGDERLSFTAEEFGGLVLIDGAEAAPSQLTELRPSQVERIEVIKGSAATRLFPGNSKAANGVIQITTREGGSGR